MPSPPSPRVSHFRAKVAGLSQKRPPEDPELAEAQQNLRVARLADHIKRCVDQAPALTAEQRNQLAELLRPVRGA
ncbi:hypothetical protein [Mycobacterium lacus]|uniref:Uncharacterized protein n=1 Tax=Mycobacterium lacus TaxID=169765 RepID=A0A1X1XUY9_9MYCO|nr:hypothetical protein [Mycobacterium lacus]MCV7122192.1 hypothetical protein [Mycobacterium lacus]ORW02646.1 hypothetical protein AWC15_06580 [Mycobacterium lacus]BBX97027.1 hypothetical protein MLAC_23210 [Mycobacterium lacus]